MKLKWLVIGLVLAGCNYTYNKEASDQGPAQKLSDQELATPDFKTVQSLIFASKCAACHTNATGNKAGVNTETYANVRQEAARIQFATLERPTMPPGGLSPIENQVLRNWFNNGMPETVTPGLNEKPDESLGKGPDDWSKVSRVMAKKCTTCHQQPNPDAGLDLTDIKATRQRYLKIVERALGPQRDMPLAPLPALSPVELKIMMNWILSGMPE